VNSGDFVRNPGWIGSPITILFLTFLSPALAWGDGITNLQGHVPTKKIARSTDLGRKSETDQIRLAVTLKLKDPAGLATFLSRVYNPTDPLYRQFLTPAQFTDQFAASQQDVDQVTQYLQNQGLTLVSVHPNHLVIDVSGTVSEIENAFQTEIHNYIAPDGRVVFSAISDPIVTEAVASQISAVIGLNSFTRRKNYARRNQNFRPKEASPKSSGSYMTPALINSVYNVTATGESGSGETLALFELDGYTASDISYYATYFSLTEPTLDNVLVDGATGTPSTGADSGASEVTLDIELAMALAPGLTKIMVYEGPPQTGMSQSAADTDVIDVYSRIASDDLAKEISSSWGSAESETDSTVLDSENTVFQQFASQGQSFFAAAGDDAAYDASSYGDNTDLEVDDPSSQPYATGVGGTSVKWNDSGAWSSETSWAATASSGTYGDSGYVSSEGGGGGISRIWSLPTWQSGLATTPNKGSTSMRMVPDVSLNAQPSTGYYVYYSGAWAVYGGTSCAAPLWAAFTALVNEKLVAESLSRVGLFTEAMYTVAKGSSYSSDFHDIADGSTNLYYPAETGYDLSTGWGSFNGDGLFTSLTYATAPSAPSELSLSLGMLSVTAAWSASTGANSYTLERSTSSGGTYSVIATGLTTTSYTDTTVSAGTTYYYYVTATNTIGTSGESTIESISVPSPPGAPTGLSVEVLQQ
jgi:subtilase family serine protease